MENINYWISLILDGAVFGSIYSLFGLGLVLIYRTSHHLNFCLSQLGAIIMLFLANAVKDQFSFSITLLFIVLSFFVGYALHFVAMRHLTENKSIGMNSLTIVSIGLLACLDGFSNYYFSDEIKPFPSPIPDSSMTLFGLIISMKAILILGATAVFLLLIFAFFKWTDIGLKMEAVAENPTAARLRGIKVSHVLAISWGITTALICFAGVMVAPIVLVYPLMFHQIFTYSLIAVIMGGLESPSGAVVFGMVVGIIENLGSQISFIGSGLKFVVIFLLLVTILVVFPRGIWGRSEGRIL